MTDVTPEDYPPVLPSFSGGVYHLYDYRFFYRNLQGNRECAAGCLSERPGGLTA